MQPGIGAAARPEASETEEPVGHREQCAARHKRAMTPRALLAMQGTGPGVRRDSGRRRRRRCSRRRPGLGPREVNIEIDGPGVGLEEGDRVSPARLLARDEGQGMKRSRLAETLAVQLDSSSIQRLGNGAVSVEASHGLPHGCEGYGRPGPGNPADAPALGKDVAGSGDRRGIQFEGRRSYIRTKEPTTTTTTTTTKPSRSIGPTRVVAAWSRTGRRQSKRRVDKKCSCNRVGKSRTGLGRMLRARALIDIKGAVRKRVECSQGRGVGRNVEVEAKRLSGNYGTTRIGPERSREGRRRSKRRVNRESDRGLVQRGWVNLAPRALRERALQHEKGSIEKGAAVA